MPKYTIDRQTWCRGESPSRLLRGDGKMCCLGQIGLQAGLAKDEIAGKGSYWAVAKNNASFPEGLKSFLSEDSDRENSPLAVQCMAVNDTFIGQIIAGHPADLRLVSEEQREDLLKDLCAMHGIELEFVN